MDLPKKISIHEEGPREGFQIEKGPIATADKVRFIDALSDTGLRDINVVSFVNPQRVPGMADADEVARAIRRPAGVRHTPLWLNRRGLERALASPLDVEGKVQVTASESFQISNTGKNAAASLDEQRRVVDFCIERGLKTSSGIVMTAFGCNIEGEVPPQRVVDGVQAMMDVLVERGLRLETVRLADTVGWANPQSIARVVGLVRERWPDLRIGLHLHDTRGTGLANAMMGLTMGIDLFDSSCAGLGGCPFAGHAGAAGNICTEDLVFMCHEMGIETDIDLDALIECARLAEEVVGHPLPGKIMKGGSLTRYREVKNSLR